MKGVTVKQETRYDDGNYCALIGVYGFEFSIITLENGEIAINGTGSKNRSHKGPRWQLTGAAKIARQFAEKQIN